jgi:phage-related protein
MAQSIKKRIQSHPSARKEVEKFPEEMREKFWTLVLELAHCGSLEYPDGRKLRGHDLFEMRVKSGGVYRCLYSYWGDEIVLLSAFQKKSQKTPIREIEKAKTRRDNLD